MSESRDESRAEPGRLRLLALFAQPTQRASESMAERYHRLIGERDQGLNDALDAALLAPPTAQEREEAK